MEILGASSVSSGIPASSIASSIVSRKLGAPGVIEIEADGQLFRAAYNFLADDESDLSTRGAGDDGEWAAPEAIERDYTNLTPLAILAALALLAVHQLVLRRTQLTG